MYTYLYLCCYTERERERGRQRGSSDEALASTDRVSVAEADFVKTVFLESLKDWNPEL